MLPSVRLQPICGLRPASEQVEPTGRFGLKMLRNALENVATESTLAAVNTKLGATLTTDVSDRVGRLLGHVTVDNATLAVTQSGSWTIDTELSAAGPLALDATTAATN